MIIREYRPGDLETLYKIDSICFPRDIAYTKLELSFYVMLPNSITLIAEDNLESKVIGFIVACVEQGKKGHIITIDVLPEHRRGTVGSRLLAAAEQQLYKKGVKKIFLETSIENKPAIEFYQKHKYTIVDTLPEYYKKKIDAYLFFKSKDAD